MSKITVTAAEGVRAKVTIQKPQTLNRSIPELRHPDGTVIAAAVSESFQVFTSVEAVTFASEARDFEIDASTRLLVEEQSA